MQSREQKERGATVEPLVSPGWSDSCNITGILVTHYRLNAATIDEFSMQGSMEWYQAADPQPHYLVVPATAASHSSIGSHSQGASVVQQTANNIVALRAAPETTDVTVLECEIG